MTDDHAGPDTAAALVLERRGDDHRGLLFEHRQMDLAGGRRRGRHQGVLAGEPAAGRAVARRCAAGEHAGVPVHLAGAALAGAVVVGINPTKRGAELAADISHADCRILLTEEHQVPLLDDVDLSGLDHPPFIAGTPAHRVGPRRPRRRAPPTDVLPDPTTCSC